MCHAMRGGSSRTAHLLQPAMLIRYWSDIDYFSSLVIYWYTTPYTTPCEVSYSILSWLQFSLHLCIQILEREKKKSKNTPMCKTVSVLIGWPPTRPVQPQLDYTLIGPGAPADPWIVSKCWLTRHSLVTRTFTPYKVRRWYCDYRGIGQNTKLE